MPNNDSRCPGQPDGIHTIPVRETIVRGAVLLDPQPAWANVRIADGRLVEVLPASREIDLLAALNTVYEQIAACKRHERMTDPCYEKVWLGLCDAADGIHDALDGWPA